MQPLAGDNGSAAAVLTGTIFKLEVGYHGRSHQWMAPEPAVHAVTVLEALSAPIGFAPAAPSYGYGLGMDFVA
jgi:hypothetical protein